MLTLRNATCTYDGDGGIDGVTCTIDRGEFVVLVGANGAGKTTLLDCLNGLKDPDRGTVEIDGESVQADPLATRTTVARVFEHPDEQLLCETVAADVAFGPENLGLPRPVINERVADSLKAVVLADHGERPIDSLSGGEQTRVAVAGALAMDPDFLLLDEPTTGVDHPGRQAILSTLGSLRDADVGVVLATHDLRDLDGLVDRVIGLAKGRVAFDGNPIEAVPLLHDLGVRVPSEWPEHTE